MFPEVPLLYRIVLTILDFLLMFLFFPHEAEVLSRSVKKFAVILMGIALSL